MREIILTQGRLTLVDEEDYEELSKHKWYCDLSGYKDNGRAVRIDYPAGMKGEKKKIYMHQVIMGKKPGFEIDHIDGDPLNNLRSNLRFCTSSQNKYNRGMVCGVSKYKGVTWNKKDKKWVAKIRTEGKTISLGSFDAEKDAAKAYDEGARKYHGEFARCNSDLEIL